MEFKVIGIFLTMILSLQPASASAIENGFAQAQENLVEQYFRRRLGSWELIEGEEIKIGTDGKQTERNRFYFYGLEFLEEADRWREGSESCHQDEESTESPGICQSGYLQWSVSGHKVFIHSAGQKIPIFILESTKDTLIYRYESSGTKYLVIEDLNLSGTFAKTSKVFFQSGKSKIEIVRLKRSAGSK